MPEKYRPSNGSEGEGFMEHFCYRCIHESFLHFQDEGTRKCDILSRSLLYGENEPEYPHEWQYSPDGKPTCTAWVRWDWNNDGDPDDPDNPKAPMPDDPNQLLMPFDMADLFGSMHRDVVVTKDVITERGVLEEFQNNP